MRKRRLTRGTTLIETLTAAVMTVLVLSGAISVMLFGLTSWYRGEGRILAETDSQKATRIICQKLREACSVTVDANGLGLTYYIPPLDVDGEYVTPVPQFGDGVKRRIELDGSTLDIVTNGFRRPICDGVILTDPLSPGGAAAYRIFSSPPDATTRQVTIEVVAQRNNYRAVNVTSRTRETVYLRNVPELTN